MRYEALVRYGYGDSGSQFNICKKAVRESRGTTGGGDCILKLGARGHTKWTVSMAGSGNYISYTYENMCI